MADNLGYTEGSGKTVASYDRGGIHFQRMVKEPANVSNLATAVSVTSTATALPGTPLTDRTGLTIQNNSSQDVFLGDAGVTTSSGVVLHPGESLPVEAGPDNPVYGIVASSTADVRVWEFA